MLMFICLSAAATQKVKLTKNPEIIIIPQCIHCRLGANETTFDALRSFSSRSLCMVWCVCVRKFNHKICIIRSAIEDGTENGRAQFECEMRERENARGEFRQLAKRFTLMRDATPTVDTPKIEFREKAKEKHTAVAAATAAAVQWKF